MAEAKSRGKVRIEDKDYATADGDVVEFRFNVCRLALSRIGARNYAAAKALR